jgi:hypothetical protein
MYIGWNILKALWITFRRFVETYIDDLRWLFKKGFGKRYTPETIPVRQHPLTKRGIFTVQYPQERLPLPERFRGFPFLVYDDETGKLRCTACGDLRAGLPAPVHLDCPRHRPADRQTAAGAGGVLRGHQHLHELRLLRRVLPLQRHQDGARD